MIHTPEHVTDLAPHQIFVFGSNDNGQHGAGAAWVALDRFGALWGIGRGPQGQSYAIATLDHHMKRHNILDLKKQVERLFEIAVANPSKQFLVTKIGCGIAGFAEAEIAPLFAGAPDNVLLPKCWHAK